MPCSVFVTKKKKLGLFYTMLFFVISSSFPGSLTAKFNRIILTKVIEPSEYCCSLRNCNVCPYIFLVLSKCETIQSR